MDERAGTEAERNLREAVERLRPDVERFMREATHWKHNHDVQVRTKRNQRQRLLIRMEKLRDERNDLLAVLERIGRSVPIGGIVMVDPFDGSTFELGSLVSEYRHD